ncbi:uncharacterized protein LOC143907299 [Temnothorax americanus]|uniref:uncharacterized protein LOC143907299 n=1 Tax=Temnothorax americanus TaxID=1964332 RepID=UPI00406832BD
MLAEEMWCPVCDAPLSFQYVENENVIGLASIFRVRCHTCHLLHEVQSSKCYKKREDGNCTQYDVNAKSALAMIDAGIGYTHMNTILSILNIPIISNTLLKRNERYVGKSMEHLACKSCREALRLEKDLMLADMSVFRTCRCFM